MTAEKSRLILVGGGGFGRELASWVDHAAAAGHGAPLAGFIDSKPDAMQGHDTPWLGDFGDFAMRPDDMFLLGVGNPATKVRIVATLRERGARFARFVHPTAIVGRNAVQGEGVILTPLSVVTADTYLGDFVTVLSFSGIGHDASVGAFTTISTHVDVMGGASLGERVMVGSGARIMPGIKVGDDAKVGAAALVMLTVKPGSTVFARAAKRLK